MGETRQIGLLVVITLTLGIVAVAGSQLINGIGFSGSAVVDRYEATLSPNGTLRETFTYKFTEQRYRMLYRSWEVPVSYTPRNSPYIQPLAVNGPPGTVSYIKDINGLVTLESLIGANTVVADTIGSLAEYNEAGCYYAPRFPPGSYDISYAFKLYPPIEYDSQYSHLNLMLGRIHIPYRNVMVVIEDAGYVEAVYAHPPSLKITRVGERITVTGSSAEDELLEIELLMKPGAHQFKGFETPVSDV